MESDGRIRSKDIGTGEVNSRALDNIRSSNYNGSHTDPENDPGTEGWQILKSGFSVFNDAIFRGTVNAARIISAVIESGIVRLTAGGKIELGGDPETGTPATATLSETGIVVGPTSLTASGVQVGTDVVIDSTGLHVDGGDVTPLWFEDRADFSQDTTLTTTNATKCSVTFTPPSWVQTLYVSVSLFGQMSEGTGRVLHFNLVGGTLAAGGVTLTVAGGSVNAASRTVHRSTASFPATFELEAKVNTGTNASNRLDLAVRAIGVRD